MTRASGRATRRHWFDFAIILGVVAVLVGNHRFGIVTPDWVLRHGHPATDVRLAYPAAIAHVSTDHLLGNVIGYLVAASLAYYLCVRSGVARWYYASFATLLLVVPPVTSQITYDVFGRLRPEYLFVVVGFSDIVGAFVGVLFVVVFAALSTAIPLRWVAVNAAIAVAASVLQLRLVVSGGTNLVAPALIGTAIAGGGMVASRGLADVTQPESQWPPFRGLLVAYVLLFAVHSGLLLGLFSAITVDVTASVVVFSHLVGLLVGIIVALTLAIVFEVFPARRHLIRLGINPDRAFQLPAVLFLLALATAVTTAAVLAQAAVVLDPGLQPAAVAIDLLAPVGVLVFAGGCLLLVSEALDH